MEVLDSSVEDLVKGYKFINHAYHCLFCEAVLIRSRVSYE